MKQVTQSRGAVRFGTRVLHAVTLEDDSSFVFSKTNSKFMISRDEGPVPGMHLVKVLEVSEQKSYGADGRFSISGTRSYQREWNLVTDEELVLDLRKDQFLQG